MNDRPPEIILERSCQAMARAQDMKLRSAAIRTEMRILTEHLNAQIEAALESLKRN